MSETGRMSPHAVDLEELVLGAILIEKDKIHEIAPILSVESFYVEANQLIYKSILRLFDKSLPIDLTTVVTELKRTKNLETVGGASYIAKLTGRVGSATNAEYHARLIKEQHIRRELINKASSITNKAYDASSDVFDILADTERHITSMGSSLAQKQARLISEAVDKVIEKQKQANGAEIKGVQFGINSLDELTGGAHDTDLIILAARPGAGKTGCLITFLSSATKDGGSVAFFSLEMPEEQIASRLIAQISGVGISKIIRNKLTDGDKIKLQKASVEVANMQLYIDDTPSLSLIELKSKAVKLKREANIKLIAIDYLQLMNDGGKSKSQEQEISNISRALKGLAKELSIPIIALSQLSRDVEKSGKKQHKPQLSSLRGSGAIEQDADVVIFIFRPDYHDKDATDEHGNSLKGQVELIVAKNRNGPTEIAKAKFEEWTTRFYDDVPSAVLVEEELPPF